MQEAYFIGVDVGTSSARAALVSLNGQVLKQATHVIKTWNPIPKHYEQSSDDIWKAVCSCVKSVCHEISKEDIKGISFDATCSLVILGQNGEPLSVSTTMNSQQNVILWMDHRAFLEAELINATKNKVLQKVGGKISVEMQMPKLCWLKKNHCSWTKIWKAFDLPDFLTWRSTECDVRSLCSVVCKWNYDADCKKWDENFLREIGLEEFCQNDFEIIGKDIRAPGASIGLGVTENAAKDLGLLPGTKVGVSLIDAYAGALGVIGVRSESVIVPSDNFERRLALICGTSTCHLSLSVEPCWAQGIWGPYKNAIFSGYFVNEGGQSATGILLDHIIKSHPQFVEIKSKLKAENEIHSYMNLLLEKISNDKNLDDPCFLSDDLHIWPDFHGNRSPIADPSLRGMISGLGMDLSEESLAIEYIALVQALAYGTRHIIDTLLKHKRVNFDALIVCGGLAKNAIFTKSHADICQIPVIVPNEQEMILVGTAMLGACAAKFFTCLESASKSMGGTGKVINPKKKTFEYHNKKYRVFLEMLNDQLKYSKIMKGKI